MERVKVAVIGGGILGASVLYHLARRGVGPCVLLEKSVLTAGSTWHAAANGNSFAALPNVARLQKRSIELYPQIEEETGVAISIHRPGGLFLATNADRLAEYRTLHGRGRRLGFGWRMITPEEIAERHPLTNVSGVLGGLWGDDDGHIDPYGATQAMAKGARMRGAEIREHCAVRALRPQGEGWIVTTDAGELAADTIVNAAGLWADEVAAMTGAALPMVRMEHHYLITEAIPEIAGLERELPLIRDGDSSFYMRQERQGLLLGVYEQQATPWATEGMPRDFGQELLPDAVDRLMPNLEQAFERFPALASAGIAKVVNGPFCFTPDGMPLIGPMPGQRGHFCAAGFLAGLNMGAGFGEAIAEWIDTGRTRLDLASCDVGRYGAWANGTFAHERCKDTYAHRYQLHYPFEERDAGRPARTFPTYDRHIALGAVMGPVNGWERPLWYAPDASAARDHYAFSRQNWFDPVCAEMHAVRTGVGAMDASAFAKYRVEGPKAEPWLNRMIAGALPSRAMGIRLAHMLNEDGGIVAEFSITRLEDGAFLLLGASAAQQIHLRWMERHLIDGVEVRAVTAELGAVAVQGPGARALLNGLGSADLSTESFPYMSAQRIEVAGISCLALRVSFVGELGWELYCAPGDLVALWDAVIDAGAVPFGARALDWLRLEKGYARYGSEVMSEVRPHEIGMGFVVRPEKLEFIGKDAVVNAPLRWHLRQLRVSDGGAMDPIGQETILADDGSIAGYVTSGGYGATVGMPLAMALLNPGFEDGGRGLHLDVQGELIAAIVLDGPPHDPDGARMRS